MSLWSTCALSIIMVVASRLSLRLMWAAVGRLGFARTAALAGVVALAWPSMSQASAPLLDRIDIEQALNEIRAVAAEEPVVDFDQCGDEDLIRCYQQWKDQYADQMLRIHDLLERLQLCFDVPTGERG
ncbi:MAG: hypothetical protein AAFV53_40335 [Myxococcota bacterium]